MKTCTRLIALVLTLCMLTAVLPSGASALEGYETNHCIVFASEPGATSPYVYYYKGGQQQGVETMTWVDGGVHGKAVQLDGTSEYMSVGYYQTLMNEMTFSTWINFQGAVDPANPASAYWQRLLTMASGDLNYFTVSPHAVDPAVTDGEGGVLDGLYMEYYRGISDGNSEAYRMKAFEPSRPNYSHYGLPQNEWHHMAIVADEMSVRLYVDGVVALEEVFLMNPAQMNVDSIMIGKSIWDNAPLHAQLDDTFLFDVALTADQILSLMDSGDPSVVNNPTPSVPSTSVYQPTEPVTTIPQMDMEARNDDQPLTVFGLEVPLWGVAIGVGLLGFIAVMILIVNLYEIYWRKKHNKPFRKKAKAAAPVDVAMDEVKAEEAKTEEPKTEEPKTDEPKPKKGKKAKKHDDEEPAISIKAAALQKRMEEHERFLAEEAKEKEEVKHNDDASADTDAE